MFAIIEFDIYRQGRLISEQELAWYTERLGESVTDGLQYFIGNGLIQLIISETRSVDRSNLLRPSSHWLRRPSS